MKRAIRIFVTVLSVLLLCTLTACGGLTETGGNVEKIPEFQDGGVLVAYFSRSGNTAKVADLIAAAAGGDIVRIEPASPYPADYEEMLTVARRERAGDARPALAASLKIDMDKYDTVFIGYPIWHGGEPMIIRSFCDAYAGLKGKKVYPFSTSASSGGAAAQTSLKDLYPDADFGDGLHLTDAALSDASNAVADWLKKPGMSASDQTESVTGIGLTMNFAGECVKLALADNAASRDLVRRLRLKSLTLSFTDFNGSEKIAYPSPPLEVEGVVGCDPAVGDVTVYKPWGNIAIFYRDTSAYSDALAPIGRLETGGAEKLAAQTGDFDVVLAVA